MKTLKYIIKDPQGIHARPAGILIAEAKKYSSNMTISNKGKKGDLKRIFSVLGLCVKNNEEIEIEIEGSDEEAASIALTKCLEENL